MANLEAWLFTVRQRVLAQAFDRGDLATLQKNLQDWQTTAPDLIAFSLDSSHLVIYLDSVIDDQELTKLLNSYQHLAAGPFIGPSTKELSEWSGVVEAVWQGHIVLIGGDSPRALTFDIANPPHRSVSRPETELAVRGPQEALVEWNAVKLGQLRTRLPSAQLSVETITVGQRYPVSLYVVYDVTLASPEVLFMVRSRLKNLPIDTATNATRIGSLIRDHRWSLFPTVRYSERADWVALQIASGKVAILVAGDPFAITLPAVLADFYQTTEDYATAWYDASFIRVIRLLAWGFGVMLPGWYIALTEVNPDLISPTLFDIVAGSHTGLPFTPFVEVVVMILVIEILREAALRLPKVLATTIGTVGAIVVGTAVVKAGFVSPQIIVLMTFTALSLFSVPSYELLASWRFASWAVLLAAFALGIYGIVLVTLALFIELVSLTSFGTPYLVPWSPWRSKDWGNFVMRVPWHTLKRRLTSTRTQDLRWSDKG